MKIVPDTMIWVLYCTLREGYRHQLIEPVRGLARSLVHFRVHPGSWPIR